MNSATPILVILVAGFVAGCDAAHDDMNNDDSVQSSFEAYDESAVTVASAATAHHERMMAMAADDGLADVELDYQAQMRTMMDRFDSARGDLGTCAMRSDDTGDPRMPHDMGDMTAAAAAIRTEMTHHDEMMGNADDAAAVEGEETRHLAVMKTHFDAMRAHRMDMGEMMSGMSMCGMMHGGAAR